MRMGLAQRVWGWPVALGLELVAELWWVQVLAEL